MRLLCATPATQWGGTEYCVEAVCAGARARGWDVTVATAESNGGGVFRARLSASEIPSVPSAVSSSPWALGAAPKLLELARATGADVVWLALPWVTVASVERMMLAAAGFPVLSSFFLVDPALARKPWRWLDRWSWRVGRQRTTVLCTADRETVAKAFGFEEAHIEVVPPGAFRSPSPPETRRALRARVRKEFELDGDAFAVLSLGRLERQKGWEAIVDAATRTREALSRAVFWIAGEGSERPALERRIAELSLGDRVFLLGHREPEALLAAADAFALPSRFEGVPLSLLEALEAKLPIAASAVGGIPEMLENGQSGYLLPPACGRALATALESMARAPVEAAELERRARRARAVYDPDVFVDRTLEALRRFAVDAAERRRASRVPADSPGA